MAKGIKSVVKIRIMNDGGVAVIKRTASGISVLTKDGRWVRVIGGSLIHPGHVHKDKF